MEGAIAEQPFRSFQGLKQFKKERLQNQTFVDELCRGITVNTSYSSNIQVRYTGHARNAAIIYELASLWRIKN